MVPLEQKEGHLNLPLYTYLTLDKKVPVYITVGGHKMMLFFTSGEYATLYLNRWEQQKDRLYVIEISEVPKLIAFLERPLITKGIPGGADTYQVIIDAIEPNGRNQTPIIPVETLIEAFTK